MSHSLISQTPFHIASLIQLTEKPAIFDIKRPMHCTSINAATPDWVELGPLTLSLSLSNFCVL